MGKTGPGGAGYGKPRHRVPSQLPPSTKGGDSCCPMVAAARSLRQGKPRLARRYALMSLRLIAGRI